MKKLLFCFAIVGILVACNSSSNPDEINNDTPSGSGSDINIDGKTVSCKIETSVKTYNNETATDYSTDEVGTNEDLYWELIDVKAKNTISINYNGDSVTVTNPNTSDNTVISDGAHVKVILGKKSRINLSGTSNDGSIRIYSKDPEDESKFILSLDNLTLSSTRGPAINSQVGKRVYVIISGTCSLEDASNYTDNVEGEDSKGCLFSEGNQIWSGDGVLKITGNYKNAIVTDGYFYMRPGPTIVVLGAASNGIKVKGDSDLDEYGEQYGIYITGGLIWASVSSESGKCLTTDCNFRMTGGKLILNTTGNAIWDDDDKDISSPSCIKADLNMYFHDGEMELRSTGKAGKGLSVDGNMHMYGGILTAATTGDKYTYGQEDASPKAVKIDGSIIIDAGTLNLCSLGRNDGAEAFESKSTIEINDGEIYTYAYDDAINAATSFTVNGGNVWAYSQANDAIDSNGNIYINGGKVYAFSYGNEAAYDNDNPGTNSVFQINGGTVIGISGTSYSPSSSSSQNSAIIYGVSSNMDLMLSILDSKNNPVTSFTYASSVKNASVLVSTPNLVQGNKYTLSRGGTLTSYTDSFYNMYDGGTYSGGTALYSFTQSSRVTTVGSKSDRGGGGGGQGR